MIKDNKTKREATLAAQKALKRMRSPGWKIRVWENLGWHWSLVRPGAVVHFERYTNRFWGQIEPCLACWSDPKTYADPNHAYAGALCFAKKHIGSLLTYYATAAGWKIQSKDKAKKLIAAAAGWKVRTTKQ